MKKLKRFLASFMLLAPIGFAISCGSKDHQTKPSQSIGVPFTNLTASKKKVVKLKSGEKEFWKTPKHFFYIMVDSLTSSRLLDSYDSLKKQSNDYIKYIKQAAGNSDLKSAREKRKKNIDDKISALNDFNLKMNVVSPDYGTAAGLGALLGGANNAAFLQELRRKKDVSRKSMFQEAWNNLIEDVANQKHIDKIYVNSLEYYDTEKVRTFASKETFDKKLINISNKAKSKLILNNFKDDHEYYKSENFYKVLDDYGTNFTKENNFSFINAMAVHDNFKNWNYDSYIPPYGNKVDFFETLLIFKDKLKKLGIYDDSEIMIVSDHGKQINNYSLINKSKVNYEMQKEYMDNDYERYSLSGLNANIKHLKHKTKSNSDLFGSEARLVYMTSILHKPITKHHHPLEVDYKNLYYSADAISQLYYDMYIPTNNLQFNFHQYIDSLKQKENNDGSYNSFVNNPFAKDLSKRILFSLRKNVGWGLRESLYLANKGFIWNGPFWEKDKNNKWTMRKNSMIEFILDDVKFGKSPWFNELRKKVLSKSDNAYKMLGDILDKFSTIIK